MIGTRRLGLGAFALVLVLAAAVAACGGGGQPSNVQEVTVKATDYKFDPATVTVQANKPVKVTLVNDGSVRHDWTVQGMDNPKVSVIAEPGKSASVEFTPAKPGTYKVECKEPGHADLGMVGQLVVQ